MEQFIMQNPNLFTVQDFQNFLSVGFITQEDYNALMSNVEAQSATSSSASAESTQPSQAPQSDVAKQ